jgi:hypothetical protein
LIQTSTFVLICDTCTHAAAWSDHRNSLRLSETPEANFGIRSAFLTRGGGLMAPLETEESSRSVEISGWDLAENFFVEKTVLRRCDDGSRKVLLHTPLRVGALVFARLSDEQTADRTIPVTYQVASINANFSDEGREIQLLQRHPRQTLLGEWNASLADLVMKN